VSGLATLNGCKVVPLSRRDHVRARDIAEPIASVPKAAPNDTMIDALRRTTPTERRLLVFDGENLVGIVTPTDIMRIVQRAPLRHTEHNAA
jgi:CBS domain-containing protein